MATQQELDAGSTWTHGVHQEAHTRLEYEYRMVCSAHYYGNDCDTLCRPRDDQFGHYTCDANGDKICLDGWQKDSENAEGDYCTKGRHTYIFFYSFTTGQFFSEHVNDFHSFCGKIQLLTRFDFVNLNFYSYFKVLLSKYLIKMCSEKNWTFSSPLTKSWNTD